MKLYKNEFRQPGYRTTDHACGPSGWLWQGNPACAGKAMGRRKRNQRGKKLACMKGLTSPHIAGPSRAALFLSKNGGICGGANRK